MVPHPPLKSHYPNTAEKSSFVKKLFDDGAEYYDAVVDWGFFHTGGFYRRWAQERNGLKPGMHLLDVACGTGLMATAACKILGTAENIVCLDPSEGMLAVAKTKLAARFVLGCAEQMPFPDNTFDFLTMGYALRHVTDLEGTFQEFRRVLKPGGKLLILEVTKPNGGLRAALFRLYFKKIYPWVTHLFTRSQAARNMMYYYWETMEACVPPEDVLRALRSAGLEKVERAPMLGIFSEYTAVKAALSSSPHV